MVWLRRFILGLCLSASLGAEISTLDEDQRTLKSAGLQLDAKALLDYFRSRTFVEADPKELSRLLQDLGDADFGVREAAFKRLADLGAKAMTGLKQAESDTNPEVRRRVMELKHRVEFKAEFAVQAAAIRSIARAHPAGAVEVLLGFVPFTTDAAVVDEIGKALGVLAASDKDNAPALLQALRAPVAIQRALAGEALARAQAVAHLSAARALLRDPDPTVRLRVALALVARKEKEAVPVLIELLGELDADKLWQVEEILVRLAGEQAPTVALGNDEAGKKAARDAWRAWLAKEDKLDLGKLVDRPLLGYTLLVQQHVNPRGIGGFAGRRAGGGEVLELDTKTKAVRWRFEVDTYPVDAVVVGPDRVLVAEYQAGRVTERTFKGEEKWRKEVGGNPVGIQRLPNGNTFIVMQNRLLEINRSGAEVFSFARPQHDIMRARKVRSGDSDEIVYITNTGILSRIDAKGRPTGKSVNVGAVQVLFGSIDVLPNGHVLMPEFQTNRVVEYDRNGNAVGRTLTNVQWPNSAERLPDGHTLVASQNTRRVIEFDAKGQGFWSHQCDGSVFNAHRR
jgi:HEAT repeat protein